MIRQMIRQYWNPAVVFLLLVCLALGCYWPGLHGGFLFDDFHNLQELGTYGSVHDWETLRAYAFNGISGPSGRPLSLLSFLLNDNTWPSVAQGFKLTNLLIHLLCGLLLCWSMLKLLRAFGTEEGRAQWMAVFASSCWMLHPLMVSTTLYVVQRMAQLSTLFVFAGLLAYLHGRSLRASRPRAAYVWMSLAVTLGTVLAVLSKENGALLPMLLLIVEFCLPGDLRPRRTWLWMFLGLPSLALLGYLASQINFASDAWPMRPFNQPERLLSEARIIWEYLRYLLMPQIEGRGLFQDGFAISRGWLTPWTTLPAVLGLFGLLGFGLWGRRRQPLLGLAILFFFVGHLLESSVIGLELYFEHRNYLSAAFFFLPLAGFGCWLAQRISPKLVYAAACLILALLGMFTLQRAQIWGDTQKLEIYWAYANPDSPRAHNTIAAYLVRSGRVDEANARLEMAIARLPQSALLNLRLLLQKVYSLSAIRQDFTETAARLKNQPFDAQAVGALRTLTEKVVRPEAPSFYRDATLEVIDTMTENGAYGRFPMFVRLAPYLKGQIYLAKADPVAACEYYREAIDLYSDVEAALMMVAEVATAGVYDCALQRIDQAESILQGRSELSLKRPRSSYEMEIARLRDIIHGEIAAQNRNQVPVQKKVRGQ